MTEDEVLVGFGPRLFADWGQLPPSRGSPHGRGEGYGAALLPKAEIEMGRAVVARRTIQAAAAEGVAVPSFNDMVVKAAALALP